MSFVFSGIWPGVLVNNAFTETPKNVNRITRMSYEELKSPDFKEIESASLEY